MRSTGRPVPLHALAAVLMAGLLTIGISACGSHDPADADPVIDLAGLDVGNLPTAPKPLGQVGNREGLAPLVEAERLGNFIPLPREIDPALTSSAWSQVRVFDDPMSSAFAQRFVDFMSEGFEGRVDRYRAALKGFVSGFVSSGKSSHTASLSLDVDNLVMLYSDEASARASADALARTDLELVTTYRAVPVTKYPQAHGLVQTDSPGSLHSWFASGRYVIGTQVVDHVMFQLGTGDIPKLVTSVENSIDKIVPAIQRFTPTPPEQWPTMEIDIDNMLARTVRATFDEPTLTGIPGVYDRHGGLHISPDPESDVQLFEETGVDRVSYGGGFVYRARDRAGARQIVEDRLEGVSKQYKHADSPKNLPVAQCRHLRGDFSYKYQYYCNVSYGRYAAEIFGNQVTEVHQRISAQYALLVNGEK